MRRERAASARRDGPRAAGDRGGGQASGHIVFDVEDASVALGGKTIMRDFSTRVARGDRIGLIGPNGVGKTTLLRLLIGGLTPDTGRSSGARTSKWSTSTSSANNSIPSAPSSIRSPMGTTRWWSVASRGTCTGICGLPVPARARAVAGQSPVGRRAQPAAPRASAHQTRERPDSRRADERPRPRDARTGRSRARRLSRHDSRRQSRPRVSRQRGDERVRRSKATAASRSTSAATRIGCVRRRRGGRRGGRNGSGTPDGGQARASPDTNAHAGPVEALVQGEARTRRAAGADRDAGDRDSRHRGATGVAGVLSGIRRGGSARGRSAGTRAGRKSRPPTRGGTNWMTKSRGWRVRRGRGPADLKSWGPEVVGSWSPEDLETLRLTPDLSAEAPRRRTLPFQLEEQCSERGNG